MSHAGNTYEETSGKKEDGTESTCEKQACKKASKNSCGSGGCKNNCTNQKGGK